MGPVHEFGNTNRPNADTFIGADVPANLVVHYFVIVIQSRSIHIGMVNLKHSHAFIHLLENVFYGLHRTAELNNNMSIEHSTAQMGPLASCWHCSRTHTKLLYLLMKNSMPIMYLFICYRNIELRKASVRNQHVRRFATFTVERQLSLW
jgi:hypothetical protein